MILDIVKQAVQIKITCKSESPLISVAEYCYACSYALSEMGETRDEIKQIGNYKKVEDIRENYVPRFKQALPEYEKDPKMYRLLHLLIMSRVTGDLTDEIRELL